MTLPGRLQAQADELVDADTIAAFFPVTAGQLGKLRHLRTGPVYYRLGRRIFYKPTEVQNWLNQVMRRQEPVGLS
ncbi:MAG: hypothetical protein ACYTEQ_05855 [Planctomycetota bacterium]